jgi:hypothetical protein
MNTSSTIHVGAVLFEGFELLDFYGPLEMLGLLEDGDTITVVAEKTGAVRSSAGPCGMAEATMAGSGGFDVLLIPGGIGNSERNGQPAIPRRIEATGGDIADCCDRLHRKLFTGKNRIARWAQSDIEQESFSGSEDLCAKGRVDREGPMGGGR